MMHGGGLDPVDRRDTWAYDSKASRRSERRVYPGMSVMPDIEAPRMAKSAQCLNCGTGLAGPFCAQCGQRDIPPYPSVRELAVDAFWELSGWDGRFASTVRTLVRRPGLLTREFLEGRRARYISPLRLYLLCSLLYFVSAAAAPDVKLESGATMSAGLRTSATIQRDTSGPVSRSERVANATSGALDANQPLSKEDRDSVLADIARAPTFMQPFLRRSVIDPVGFKRGIFEAMPRMLFALLPVFAAIVAVFYRGRKYPEHLYFAIHLHAFVFLALTLAALVKFTRFPPLVGGIGLAALLTIPVYSTLAFRNTYGGSLTRTLIKESAIGAIYAATCILGFVVTIYWVSLLG